MFSGVGMCWNFWGKRKIYLY